MIKLFLIFFLIIPFVHADEFTPFVKCRRGAFRNSDFFVMKGVIDRQSTWYIMNTATLKSEKDTTSVVSLRDDKKTILSANKNDVSSCSEKAVSTYFPSDSEFPTTKMDNPNDTFKCFCKNKPKLLNGCGFLYSVEELPIVGGYNLNILYCRNGQTTDEKVYDQTPLYEILKLFKGIKW